MAPVMLSSERRRVVEKMKDIDEKVGKILKNKKNVNNILELIGGLEDENEKVLLCCLKGLHKVFIHFLSHGCMANDEKQAQEGGAAQELKEWLLQHYRDTQQKLILFLQHEEQHVQELALCTLMKFVECESKHPLVKVPPGQQNLPKGLLKKIILSFLNEESDLSSFISRFQEYLEYDDIRLVTMKILLHTIKAQAAKKVPDALLINIHAILDVLTMSSHNGPDAPELRLLCKAEGTTANKQYSLKAQRKIFTALWLEFLKQKLPSSLYRKILVNLHDKVMPHMTNPLLLSDFLTESYNIGGAISLLALNGLFVLVHSFNLEYPNFYKQLYALFEPSVFHAKYRARFFFLTDLFLTSSHISAYLVAAFAKKLARLSLTAPPDSLTLVLPFILNLIKRHKNLTTLLHRPDGPTDITGDPYDMDEPDPAKCRALESSLWEIKTLQSHYHHSISKEAKKIEKPLSSLEEDLSNIFETTIEKLLEDEMSQKVKEVPVCYQAPKGLFGNKEDKFTNLWTF